MKILRAASELMPGPRKLCVAIGVFDGVHLGHQQVIRQAVSDARQHEAVSLAVTFDAHPRSVVAPDRAPRLIYSLPQKLRAIEALGVQATLLIHFDRAFSEQPAEVFIQGLAREAGRLHSVCVGSDFSFGYQRGGNVDLLRQLGAQLHFQVHGLSAIALNGQPVSSTRIREAIRSGDLDAASQLLGRAYAVAGRVVRGDQLGRQLDFPTANLLVDGLMLPPNGVYAAHAEVCGAVYRSVVNLGFRPTLKNPQPALRFEVHLLDFHGDLYGEEMEVVLVDKLRDEQAFSSLEALRAQIAKDIVAAQELF